MADVFQEVDEMMKQERLQKIWKEYGNWIIAFVVFTIVFTGAFSAYKSWNISVQEKQTAILIDAFENPDFADTIQDTVKDLRPNLRAIGLMNAASKHVSDGKIVDAVVLYKAVKDDTGIKSNMRDLASVLYARATLESGEAADIASLKSTLKAVAANTNSVWKHHANLELALIAKNQDGDIASALSYLKEISAAQNVPASLQERASALAHVYELDSKKNTNEGS